MYLENIRDYVDLVIQGKKPLNRATLIKVVEENLNRLTNGKQLFTVNIIDLDFKDKPFIMSCYPDAEYLEKLNKSLATQIANSKFEEFMDTWTNISKWCIEIDSRVIDRKNPLLCVENGSQFVAILCHEIGHTKHTYPIKLVNNYKLKSAEFKLYERMFLAKGTSVYKLFLPMFTAIDGLRIIINRPGNDLSELAADAAVPDEYKPHLVDYIEHKILRNPMTASGIVVTNEEYDNEQAKGIVFTKESLFLMKKRRSALKVYINTLYRMTHSSYVRKLCAIINKGVSGHDIVTEKMDLRKDRYITEAFDRDDYRFTREANSVLEVMNVTDRDIALISIQAENIATPEDKAYVINTIYDYIEAITHKQNKELKKYKDATKIPANLLTDDPKLKQLNELKTRVMNTKVSDDANHYGVFIKYPKGYEG